VGSSEVRLAPVNGGEDWGRGGSRIYVAEAETHVTTYQGGGGEVSKSFAAMMSQSLYGTEAPTRLLW
jgi:hypothetical protein